jgi:dihydropteroate synthase
MFTAIERLRVPYIMMHMKGTPQNMQINPVYENVIAEVKDFFISRLKELAAIGFTDNIILDPGFGFGKTVENNYQLLKGLLSFKELGFPVLAGLSRKSMINRILDTTPNEAINGTTVLNTIALFNGANILRVHDVKEAVQAIRLYEYYMKTENVSLKL